MIGCEDTLKGSYQCQQQQLHLSSFITDRDVNYSCGSCGYELNLNSSNRNTSLIDSNYEKSIKKGLISFFSVDESRLNQIQQLPWIPFFNSNKRQRQRQWGLGFFQRRRIKLLCRRCGVHLGYAHGLPSHSWDGISDSRIFYIKLNALQPSFYEEPSLNKYDTASSSLVF